MPIKTKRTMITKKTKKTRNKTSKRVLEMREDPDSVWGKNKPLEKFWSDLSAGENVVVIYNNGKHKFVKLPNSHATKTIISVFDGFDADKEITAVLSSNSSQDAYEVYLYPKAKDKSVDNVIKNYKKYFKPMGKMQSSSMCMLKKVRVPL